MFRNLIQNSNTQAAADIFSGDIPNSGSFNSMLHTPLPPPHQPQKAKKKRNLPGNPDPDAEVIALSPTTLLATNRFVCEICNKGFQRDQNLQLHRRGHNLPWKLKQRSSKEVRKRAYVCPEPSCLHHHPSRALGDLTGIKKHYCRKHGEKKWKCDKCSKIYAVQSDWKAHSKTCGTREYRCDCGTLFSRKDSFITHRAFCDALAEESARLSAATNSILAQIPNDSTSTAAAQPQSYHFQPPPSPSLLPFSGHRLQYPDPKNQFHIKHDDSLLNIPHSGILAAPSSTTLVLPGAAPPSLSATGLLQKAATVGSTMAHFGMHGAESDDGYTRDFLGLTGDQCRGGAGPVREMMPLMGNSAFHAYVGDTNSTLKQHGFGFSQTCSEWGENSIFF